MERELTKEEIIRNNVETINQYKVLQYLKKNLNVEEFRIVLYNPDTIKVLDKEDAIAYFKYENSTKEILFIEEENSENLGLNMWFLYKKNT